MATGPRYNVAQAESRLVVPQGLPAADQVDPAAPPPQSHAAAGETIALGNDMPPMNILPQTAKEAEAIDPGWKPIGAVTVNITNPSGELPKDLAAPRFVKAGAVYAPANEGRNWEAYGFYWVAAGSYSNPLYFEEPNVERYGYKLGCLQPAVSAAHFFATIPLLPYKMVVHPPQERVYTLGYYRPGDRAPLQHERFHLDPAAATAETGAVIGMILLLN